MSETEHQKRARTQTESQAAATAHKVGIQHQSRAVNNRKNNPKFYEKFTKSDLEESKSWGYLTDRFRPWLADDHILSNRRQVHRLQRELLNKVRAEQAVVGASPGSRLRDKPLLNALAQGLNPELDEPIPLDAAGQSAIDTDDMPAEYQHPMDSEERSVMDDVANVATARQAMGVDSAGSEALTTATTESRTVHEEETEQKGWKQSAAGIFD